MPPTSDFLSPNRRRGLQFAAALLSATVGLLFGQQLFRIVVAFLAPPGVSVPEYIAQTLAGARDPNLIWCVAALWASTALAGVLTAFTASVIVCTKPGPRAILAAGTSLVMAIIFSPLSGIFRPLDLVTGSAVAAAAVIAFTLCIPAWAARINNGFLRFALPSR